MTDERVLSVVAQAQQLDNSHSTKLASSFDGERSGRDPERTANMWAREWYRFGL